MFKRKPRSRLQTVVEFFFPRGGWYRATRYIIHRLRRLPDPAYRISRGIAAGAFISFTPFFGFHFILSSLIALVIRGNVVAAILATFIGNPITFPIIAAMSMRLGNRFLGNPPGDFRLPQVADAFADAWSDIWHNMAALFTDVDADWSGLGLFMDRVFLPYLVGGLLPGLATALIAYGLSRPVITTYQKARVKRLRKRYEKRMAERAKATSEE